MLSTAALVNLKESKVSLKLKIWYNDNEINLPCYNDKCFIKNWDHFYLTYLFIIDPFNSIWKTSSFLSLCRQVIKFSTRVSLSNWSFVLFRNVNCVKEKMKKYLEKLFLYNFDHRAHSKIITHLLNLWWLVTWSCRYNEFWTINPIIGRNGRTSIFEWEERKLAQPWCTLYMIWVIQINDNLQLINLYGRVHQSINKFHLPERHTAR